MNYRSIADLGSTIRRELHRIPADVDLVVGIPRSGMLAASIIALALNRKLADLSHFQFDLPLLHGSTRNPSNGAPATVREARSILLVDDSVRTGRTIREARRSIHDLGFAGTMRTLAVFAAAESTALIDIHLEKVALPRVFEWNVMHRVEARDYCLDLDGVLCIDPSESENDDGPRYQRFVAQALPLVRPTYTIGHIVTSRLKKYRVATEDWLRRHDVSYGKLHMLDVADAATRRQLSLHASFKAEVYRGLKDTRLFIESDSSQAATIARLSGKPVLCHATQQMFQPGVSIAAAEAVASRTALRGLRLVRRVGARLLRR